MDMIKKYATRQNSAFLTMGIGALCFLVWIFSRFESFGLVALSCYLLLVISIVGTAGTLYRIFVEKDKGSLIILMTVVSVYTLLAILFNLTAIRLLQAVASGDYSTVMKLSLSGQSMTGSLWMIDWGFWIAILAAGYLGRMIFIEKKSLNDDSNLTKDFAFATNTLKKAANTAAQKVADATKEKK